jgi:Holliday junction resolvasome RuvABC endonuclease subunit
MSAFIGIDPGIHGALAILTNAPKYDIQVIDMPTLEINGRNRVDMHTLLRVLKTWVMVYDIQGVLIEDVGAMPGQASMFPFGFACGVAQMAVVAAELPLRLVTPAKWKKHYGLKGGKENKDQSRLLASRMFPTHAHQWARKKDDGRAEAVLLANYGGTQ